MSFKLFEIGSFTGRPVCLYEFQWGNNTYRYTSADRNIEWGLDVDGVTPLLWTAIAISDGGWTLGAGAQDFIITLPRSNPIVELFRSTSPSSPITLTCRRFHRDDPDEEMIVYWVGTVGNVRPTSPVKAEIYGLPISQTLKRMGLRKCWEINCTHVTYDESCRLNKADWGVAATITALTPTTVQVSTLGPHPGARYAGGFIEWEATAEGTLERRSIEAFLTGTTVALFGTSDRMEVGMEVTIYPACDLTTLICDEYFNNLVNYGGHEYMAKNSPFDGKQVF